jgi:flavin reductase (DIM6/NTAB) family NADH-FMN oxidoreductase RutF
MTANGFVTVSLSPPTVLVAVMPGRMHRTLATSGRHCVNVLPEGGHGLSPYFAGRTDYRNPYYGTVDGHTRLTGCLAFSRAN